MIELTKANIDVGQVGEWEDPNTWQCTMQFFESKEEAEKVKQQIVDDYEKSRKYDKNSDLNCPVCQFDYEWMTIFQNQKLRELIEKKIEWASPYKTSQLMNGHLYRELRQLLEDSKK